MRASRTDRPLVVYTPKYDPGILHGVKLALAGLVAHPSACCVQVSAIVCCSVLLGVLVTMFLMQQRPVYLVDYHVYRAPER